MSQGNELPSSSTAAPSNGFSGSSSSSSESAFSVFTPLLPDSWPLFCDPSYLPLNSAMADGSPNSTSSQGHNAPAPHTSNFTLSSSTPISHFAVEQDGRTQPQASDGPPAFPHYAPLLFQPSGSIPYAPYRIDTRGDAHQAQSSSGRPPLAYYPPPPSSHPSGSIQSASAQPPLSNDPYSAVSARQEYDWVPVPVEGTPYSRYEWLPREPAVPEHAPNDWLLVPANGRTYKRLDLVSRETASPSAPPVLEPGPAGSGPVPHQWVLVPLEGTSYSRYEWLPCASTASEAGPRQQLPPAAIGQARDKLSPAQPAPSADKSRAPRKEAASKQVPSSQPSQSALDPPLPPIRLVKKGRPSGNGYVGIADPEVGGKNVPSYVTRVRLPAHLRDAYARGEGDDPRSVLARPPMSYAALIGEALLLAEPPNQLLIADIFAHIVSRYSYYAANPKLLYNGIRHAMTVSEAFVKLPRAWGDQSGKARKWSIKPGCEDWFRNGTYVKGGPEAQSASARRRGGTAIRTEKQDPLNEGSQVQKRYYEPTWGESPGQGQSTYFAQPSAGVRAQAHGPPAWYTRFKQTGSTSIQPDGRLGMEQRFGKTISQRDGHGSRDTLERTVVKVVGQAVDSSRSPHVASDYEQSDAEPAQPTSAEEAVIPRARTRYRLREGARKSYREDD